MSSAAMLRQGGAAIEVSHLRTTYGPTGAVEPHEGFFLAGAALFSLGLDWPPWTTTWSSSVL
jgi:hypothetical protein